MGVKLEDPRGFTARRGRSGIVLASGWGRKLEVGPEMLKLQPRRSPRSVNLRLGAGLVDSARVGMKCEELGGNITL